MLSHFAFELDHCVFIVFQKLAGVFAALADPFTFVAVPGAGFLEQSGIGGDIQQIASREIPSPYMMSNSASRNGAATLFFTTLILVRDPVTTSPSLIAAMRRISMRTENRISARVPRS